MNRAHYPRTRTYHKQKGKLVDPSGTKEVIASMIESAELGRGEPCTSFSGYEGAKIAT